MDPPKPPEVAEQGEQRRDSSMFAGSLVFRLPSGSAAVSLFAPSALGRAAPVGGRGLDEAAGDEEVMGWGPDDDGLESLIAEELAASGGGSWVQSQKAAADLLRPGLVHRRAPEMISE